MLLKDRQDPFDTTQLWRNALNIFDESSSSKPEFVKVRVELVPDVAFELAELSVRWQRERGHYQPTGQAWIIRAAIETMLPRLRVLKGISSGQMLKDEFDRMFAGGERYPAVLSDELRQWLEESLKLHKAQKLSTMQVPTKLIEELVKQLQADEPPDSFDDLQGELDNTSEEGDGRI